MAYNPQKLEVFTGSRPGPIMWKYYSTDAEAAFDDTDYITDALSKGMMTGDLLYILDMTNNLGTICQVTRDVDGNATVSPLTATAP